MGGLSGPIPSNQLDRRAICVLLLLLTRHMDVFGLRNQANRLNLVGDVECHQIVLILFNLQILELNRRPIPVLFGKIDFYSAGVDIGSRDHFAVHLHSEVQKEVSFVSW